MEALNNVGREKSNTIQVKRNTSPKGRIGSDQDLLSLKSNPELPNIVSPGIGKSKKSL